MKFFQIFMLSVAVLSLMGAVDESVGRRLYVALFVASGILYLAAWTLSRIYI